MKTCPPHSIVICGENQFALIDDQNFLDMTYSIYNNL